MKRWRHLSEADIPWLFTLGRKKYGDGWDDDTTRQWLTRLVFPNPLMYFAIRTDNAFTVAYINTYPWYPGEPECNLAFTCADDGCMWEALFLLRATVDWAKKRGCKSWLLTSDSRFDLQPVAHRLGAREVLPRYRMEL